jgi:preprotein translocase subunit SecD
MADAQAGFDQLTNQPIVTFRFNAAGSDKFASFTRNNIGRVMAIVVDGRVIREPILGGRGQVSGNFFERRALTATELALLARISRSWQASTRQARRRSRELLTSALRPQS